MSLAPLLGPNWRTTLSGVLSTVIALVAAYHAFPEEIRSDPKVYIPALIAALARIVQAHATKDAATR